jgi:hypothetical protein
MNRKFQNFEIKFFETFDKTNCNFFEILEFSNYYFNYGQNGKGITIVVPLLGVNDC